MIKKNAKILLTYTIGLLVSMFLTIPLSPLCDFSPALFSTITALVTVSFVYVEIWRFGKYDALKKENSITKAIGCMSGFVIITVIIDLIIIILEPAGKVDVTLLIGAIWFYPFTGFIINNKIFLPLTLVITLALIGMAVIAYQMGVKGFSISDKILNARKKRIDEKAEKHFEEIEKIKEQYRNNK